MSKIDALLALTMGSTAVKAMMKTTTPITTVTLFGRVMHIKRDDLSCYIDDNNYRTASSSSPFIINGNKARKFRYLIDRYVTGKEAPRHTVIATCGGYQSNAMLALARIAAMNKNISFYYFTKEIPSRIKNNSVGNLHAALSCGMKCIELNRESYLELLDWSRAYTAEQSDTTYLTKLLISYDDHYASVPPLDVAWIPQGCATGHAKAGLYELAQELDAFICSSELPGPWKIYFASGTGTTAYFVSQYFSSSSIPSSSSSSIPSSSSSSRLSSSQSSQTSSLVLNHHMTQSTAARPEVTVVAIPCVGDGEYLLQQMKALDASCGSSGVYPSILSSLSPQGSSVVLLKRRFGQLYDDHLYIWRRIVDQAAIEFDLIYTPRAMELLLLDSVGEDLLHALLLKGRTDDVDDCIYEALLHYEKGCNIIYYHCGGVEGNPTQLNRYLFKQPNS